MSILENLVEQNPEHNFVKADGWDYGVVGFCADTNRLIYSETKCIEGMVEETGDSFEDCLDHFHYNLVRSNQMTGSPVIICLDI